MGTLHLKQLRKAYLCCKRQSEICELLKSIPKHEIPSEQSLVEEVLQNPVSKKYPPAKSYRLTVVKLLINFLESHIELEDYLYGELANILADTSSEEFSHVSYEIGDQGELECVTLKENRAFVTEGSTGFRSWPAAKILAEVLLKEELAGRAILELGAGVGLTGLVLLKKRPELESYSFTDCHVGVLQTLRENIALNLGHDRRACVHLLDWNVGGEVDADLVVGADIVFDKDVVPLLVKVIARALQRPGSEAIISSVIRNEETYKIFHDSVSELFACEKLFFHDFEYFDIDTEKYEIVKLSRRNSRPESKDEASSAI